MRPRKRRSPGRAGGRVLAAGARGFELAAGAGPPADVEATRARFLDRLAEVNQDYREVARFIPEGKEPTLEFHAPSEGPFAGYDVRLKRKYVHTPTNGGLPLGIRSGREDGEVSRYLTVEVGDRRPADRFLRSSF